MQVYGSNISFSTVGATQPIAGICENYSYKLQEKLDEIISVGEIGALISHGKMAKLGFSSTPPATVTALGVRAGAALAITGDENITSGLVLVTNSGAKWQRGQPMNMSAQANHYPDMPAGAPFGTAVNGTIVLSNPNTAIQLPTNKVWWSVDGLTAVVDGIVQSCSIDESVQIQEEEGSGDLIGKIIAAIIHTYKATASMEVLTSGSIPDLGSTLEAFGSFRVQDAEVKFTKGNLRSILVNGILVPGVTS